MSIVSLKTAQADLPSLVDEARAGGVVSIVENGTIIAELAKPKGSKNGTQSARSHLNLGEYIMTFPVDLDLDRNTSTLRDIDL